jgi:magnesium transporter
LTASTGLLSYPWEVILLINCVVYREGKKLADITIDQISDYMDDSANFVWVAIKDPSKDELQVMREEFDLHELAIEDAQNGHQRPKIEEYGESIFSVFHTVEIDDMGSLHVGEVAIFMGRNYILSVRHQSERGFANVRERCEREPHLLKHGAPFVLYALMDAVVDRYFPVIENLEVELESIEGDIFSKNTSVRLNIQELYSFKRKIIVLQHAIVSMGEAVAKLHGGRVPVICQGMQAYFRDVSDHLMRINKSVESIREMTTTAVQVNLSMISLGESEVTKKLASYGALFAAPTAIAGIYGMNFKFMPELESPFGYPFVLTFMVVLNFFLWRHFRKAGWL